MNWRCEARLNVKRTSFARSPETEQNEEDHQIDHTHAAIREEVCGAALTWTPATQQDYEVRNSDLAVAIEVADTEGELVSSHVNDAVLNPLLTIHINRTVFHNRIVTNIDAWRVE